MAAENEYPIGYAGHEEYVSIMMIYTDLSADIHVKHNLERQPDVMVKIKNDQLEKALSCCVDIFYSAASRWRGWNTALV